VVEDLGERVPVDVELTADGALGSNRSGGVTFDVTDIVYKLSFTYLKEKSQVTRSN
jgi:hypothetical protein